MRNSSIGTAPRVSAKISDSLQNVVLHSIRNVVSDELIERISREVDYRFRKRKITPVVTVLHMILSALWPEESFNACWQVLWDTFISWFPQFQGQSPSRRRVSEARGRPPLTLWRHLFEAVSQQAQQRSEGYDSWKGHRVVLTDGTCVSMVHTPELVKAFGVNHGHHGRGRYPLARLVTVCLAGTMTILDYALGGYRRGESSLLSSILGSLHPGDLLIGDRHFAGAPLYVEYQNHGLEFVTRAHHRLKIAKVKRLLRYSPEDFIGRLTIHKLYRRKDPSLPTHIDVRLLKAVVRIRGRRQHVWFTTSLLDPRRYPADQIVALYLQRWRIETLSRGQDHPVGRCPAQPESRRDSQRDRRSPDGLERHSYSHAGSGSDYPDRRPFANQLRACGPGDSELQSGPGSCTVGGCAGNLPGDVDGDRLSHQSPTDWSHVPFVANAITTLRFGSPVLNGRPDTMPLNGPPFGTPYSTQERNKREILRSTPLQAREERR